MVEFQSTQPGMHTLMDRRPNILFLMTDQMQAQVLAPDSPCQTPAFDSLAARGVRCTRAYTPNAICSPARASLMTGLLPHNHGVLTVLHTTDTDQCCLRTEHPHWAQRLADAGYVTGYFGKWHVERSGDLSRFGWQSHVSEANFRQRCAAARAETDRQTTRELRHLGPEGYHDTLFAAATTRPPEERGMGVATACGLAFLDSVLADDTPWACFVSVTEPHDPFVCGADALARYDVDTLPLPANLDDAMLDKPGIYRKAADIFADHSDDDRRFAAGCYYASITEIDAQYARLIGRLEAAGALDNTIIVLTSDHGELLGAHGLYMKNVGAFEEVYNIPLIVAGPGISEGQTSDARIGLHDLAPTLLELCGMPPIGDADSRSAAPALAEPSRDGAYRDGSAEYAGGRYWLTQRVIWYDQWKLVWNGFDEDELYNLEEDPHELTNRIADLACAPVVRHLMARAWRRVHDTHDHALLNSHYPVLRLAPYGPTVLTPRPAQRLATFDVSAFGSTVGWLANLDGDDTGRPALLMMQSAGQLGAAVYGERAGRLGVEQRDRDLFCLTAVDLDGNVGWQDGTPWDDVTTPFTTHGGSRRVCVDDIDGDGRPEVLVIRNGTLAVIDGATGAEQAAIDLPSDNFVNLYTAQLGPPENGRQIICKVNDAAYGDWEYANPTIIFNADLTIYLQPFAVRGAGHNVVALDVDGDGRDELLIGYSLLDHDGSEIWRLDLGPDYDYAREHADEISVADLDGDGELEVRYAGSEDFFVTDLAGNMRWRRSAGHSQNSVGGPWGPNGEQRVILNEKNRGQWGLDAAGDVLWNRTDINGYAIANVRWSRTATPHSWAIFRHQQKPIGQRPFTSNPATSRHLWPQFIDGDGFLHDALPWDDLYTKPAQEIRAPRTYDCGQMYNIIVRDIDGDGLDEVIVFDRQRVSVFHSPEL
jgi:arylsulfatase A-like enzyme